MDPAEAAAADLAASRHVQAVWRSLAPKGTAFAVWGLETQDADLRANDVRWVEGAVEKRRLEFLRGRACARQALAAVGGPRDAELPVGPSGAPGWPAGFTGSITHTAGIVGAIAAPAGVYRGIGIDVERGMRLPDGTPSHILDAAEKETLSPPLDLVAFSAKESVFKAVHPYVDRWIDFLDARITFDSGESFRVKWTNSAPSIASADLRGRYAAGADWVTSMVWIAPGAAMPGARQAGDGRITAAARRATRE